MVLKIYHWRTSYSNLDIDEKQKLKDLLYIVEQLSSLEHTVFCIVNCKGSYDQLKYACKRVLDEINELIESSVLIIDA